MMQHPCSEKKYSYGMSLVEALVFIAVSTMVLTAIVSSILYFYRTNASVMEQSLHINNARKGIEFVVRDIREATYGDEGSYPVISIGANNFSFYSDVDRDDLTESIRYYIGGLNLYKGIINPSGSPLVYDNDDEETSIVSESVRNEEENTPIFRYYDSNGVEILDYSNVSDVVFVTVTLIININPVRKPDEFTLRSSATIRNLKVNF